MKRQRGYISIVGAAIGAKLNDAYCRELGVERLTPERIAAVLVDLKQHINGDFYVIEQDRDRIVLGNRRCPFGGQVHDRPSLCMMTSNVFGYIAADAASCARVRLEETIAGGAPGCRIVIRLDAGVPEAGDEREYFRRPADQGNGPDDTAG